MRSIGILGGSFDPVHIGHLALGNFMAQFAGLDQVWLMLSPQNPLKIDRQLTPDLQRLEMLNIATAPDAVIKPCDLELTMPRPSYTIDTLRRLRSLYPDCQFRLIIGSDNWAVFDRWRQSEDIISEFGVIIYPRDGYEVDGAILPDNVTLVTAPKIEVSSTMIRKAIAQGKDMNYFLPAGVYNYILQHQLYQTS